MSLTPPNITFVPSSSLQLFSFSFNEHINTYTYAGIALIFALITYGALSKGLYNSIPAVCGTDILSSYIGAFKFYAHGKDMVQLGYDKYKSGAFRIPQINRWHVVVSGEKLIDDLRKTPDEILSFTAAVEETLLTKYLLGPTVNAVPYHIDLLRGQLNRNLGFLFPDVRDEIMHAFEDNIPLTEEWTKVSAYSTVLQIVARASNRIFVGLPLCRNPEYIILNIKFAINVSKARLSLLLFPNFLKPLAAMLLTRIPSSTRLCMKLLTPLIEERKRAVDEYGVDYPDKPNNLLAWMMDEAEGKEQEPVKLTHRILTLNFAAIHTSSMSFTHALFHLAAQPQYLDPLRKEVEEVVAEYGWTKAAMTQMHKLDSFFKESQRINGLGAVSMTRMALQDFTFSNGSRIPKGALVSVAARATHHDDSVYEDGNTFDGFRFSHIREQDGQSTTNQFAATKTDYVSFGHGKHSCPGRFFAANELKAMMAHLVMTYDIKMENEGVRPPNKWFGLQCSPDTKAEVLFRRRRA